MITDIRSYFDTQIKAVDPDLVAWESDLFGNNDQSEARADKYYNLFIGDLTPSRGGNYHRDVISVTLDIYSGEVRDLYTTFDSLYDKALDIKNCIIDTKNYNTQIEAGTWSDIEFTLATPIEEDSNDNSIRIRLEFNIIRNFYF